MSYIWRVFALVMGFSIEMGCALVVDLGPERTRFIASDVMVGDGPDPTGDGGTSTDATNEAATSITDGGACDPKKPFNAPQFVKELDVGPLVGGARLTPDMTLVVFHARLTDSPAPGSQLHQATRPNASAPWGKPEPIAGPVGFNAAGGSAQGTYPSISPDRLSIYFSSLRAGPGRIHTATRSTPDASFEEPKILAALDGEVTTYSFLNLSGDTLYFTANRSPPSIGSSDVFKTTIVSPGVGNGFVHVPDLSSYAQEDAPVVSGDGLTAFVSRRFNADGTPTSLQRVWTATRTKTTEPFGSFEPVLPIWSQDKNEHATWISPDGCVLYLMSDRSGAFKIYTATREK